MYHNFSRLIKQRKITAYRVAKETGISQSTLSDWKNGKSTPKVDKLMKIADYLNVPLEELLKDKEGDY